MVTNEYVVFMCILNKFMYFKVTLKRFFPVLTFILNVKSRYDKIFDYRGVIALDIGNLLSKKFKEFSSNFDQWATTSFRK